MSAKKKRGSEKPEKKPECKVLQEGSVSKKNKEVDSINKEIEEYSGTMSKFKSQRDQAQMMMVKCDGVLMYLKDRLATAMAEESGEKEE